MTHLRTVTSRREITRDIRKDLRQLDALFSTKAEDLDRPYTGRFYTGRTPREVILMYVNEVSGLAAMLEEHYESDLS